MYSSQDRPEVGYGPCDAVPPPVQTIYYHSPEITQQPYGDDKMSLIVAMQNSHGLVFSADSRSTVQDAIGTKHLDENRETKKVFQSKHYIVATFGRNTLFRNKANIPIEMAIDAIIEEAPDLSPQEFVDRFRSQLRETFEYDHSAVYNIVVGYPVSEGFGFDHCIISPANMNTSQHFGNQLIFFGTFDMTPRNVAVNTNWNIEEMCAASKVLIQSAIDLGDRFLVYNPVGGPIQSVSLS